MLKAALAIAVFALVMQVNGEMDDHSPVEFPPKPTKLADGATNGGSLNVGLLANEFVLAISLVVMYFM
ncbi:unnamed protein product [Tenebrio molitor]|nr:unnamed protein product [Tenebrio molitor]